MEEANVAPVLASVRNEWHWVRPAIEELLNDNPDVDAIPEDVYAACKAGVAQLWLIPNGMIVTRFEYGDLRPAPGTYRRPKSSRRRPPPTAVQMKALKAEVSAARASSQARRDKRVQKSSSVSAKRSGMSRRGALA